MHQHSEAHQHDAAHRHDKAHQHDAAHQHDEAHQHDATHQHDEAHQHDAAHQHDEAHQHDAAHQHDEAHQHDASHQHSEEEEHDPHAHAHTHGGGGEQESIVVQVDPHSRHILAMQTEEVPAAALALVNSLYGRLTVPDHAMETYSLPCAGRITLHVKSAQKVHRGDILYTVESPALSEQLAEQQKTQANLARCEEELHSMQARIARLEGVGARNSDLEEQLRFKQAEERQLHRELDTAQARLRMLAMGAEQGEREGRPALIIRAHADGTVRNVGVTQGSWGEQGAPVITMSNPAAMEITASLYSGDVPRISDIRALIPVGRENIAVGGTWRLDEQIDPDRQTRTLYFTPDTLPEGVNAGQLCRLDLYDAPAEANIVSIPDSALVKVGVDDVVFVEVAENAYAMVRVRAGASRRGMTPVSGLTPGQKIVVRGGYELKYILPGEGQKKKAGHFHADGKFHEGEDH